MDYENEIGVHRDYDRGEDVKCTGAECPYCTVREQFATKEPVPPCGGWDIEGPDHPPSVINNLRDCIREIEASEQSTAPKWEDKNQRHSGPPSLQWYCNHVIQHWADREKLAIQKKLKGYAVIEDDVFAILKDGAIDGDSLWDVWLRWWLRHGKALERAIVAKDIDVIRRCLADLLGYVFTGLALSTIHHKVVKNHQEV